MKMRVQERSPVPSHSVSVFLQCPVATIQLYKIPLTEGSLLRLAVQKEYGLDSDMIRSVSFSTVTDDFRLMVIWKIAMRRVLHLKMVTQCAMLEEFGMFLVLADKVSWMASLGITNHNVIAFQALFAYHIEALVPSSPQSAHTSQTPQRVNGTRDVHFFSVGQQGGRTLVIYMKKKGVSFTRKCSYITLILAQLDSVFRVLEPVVEKINERSKAPASFTSRFGIRPARSEWFRLYRVTSNHEPS